MDTLPTAAEAYKASKSAQNEKTQKLLSIVTKAILDAIKTEATSVNIPCVYMSDNVEKILKDKGYKVTFHSDIREDGSTYTINWYQSPGSNIQLSRL